LTLLKEANNSFYLISQETCGPENILTWVVFQNKCLKSKFCHMTPLKGSNYTFSFFTKGCQITKNNRQKDLARKVVRTAKKLASKDVWCSQNRRFKLSLINFRYNRTAGEK
jgi:hypothetical protein